MRRFPLALAVLFGASFLAGCNDVSTSLLTETPEEVGATTEGPSGDIVDASSGAPGANPHFFFLNPFLKGKLKKNQLGTFDSTLEPAVTICPLVSWDSNTESCNPDLGDPPALVEYPFGGDGVQLVLSAEKYQVVYKSGDYPMDQGHTYRVIISIYGQALGWADMAVYDPTNPDHSSAPGTITEDGLLLLNGTENQNISFRIDEGALEQEFCDSSNLEDCDVAIIDPSVGGILRVFEDPEVGGSALGALANIPSGILGPDGLPYPNPYPVVLELELDGNPQPGTIPETRQVPYFADFWSPVNGLYFDQNAQGAQGVNVVICQDIEGTGSIPEYLHDFLVIFLTRTGASGTTTELLPTVPGAEACAGFEPHADHVAASDGPVGFFGRVGAGLSKVAKSLLPKPLYAKRRIHGGLNTVVWDISPGGGGDGPGPSPVSGLTLAGGTPELLEFGALLNVDAEATSAAVTVPDGVIGEPTSITIQVLDALNQPFLFEVGVTVQVTGSNTANLTAVYDPNTETYSASYIPTALGTDYVTATLEQAPYLTATPVGPFPSAINPVGPSAENTTFSISYSEAGSPTTVTVTVLDENDQPYTDGGAFPIQVVISVGDGVSEPVTIWAVDDDGEGNFDGVYEASYTPDAYGSYDISVLIGADGVPIIDLTPVSGSPQTVLTQRLPADATQSQIVVGDGQVQSSTNVAVVVRNLDGEDYNYGLGGLDFPRPITVDVTVSGANSATFVATDPDLDGTYEGSYTPANAGLDYIDATITDATDDTVDDEPVPQATSTVAPLSGTMTVQVSITGPASQYVYGLPVQLYDAAGNPIEETPTVVLGTNAFGTVTFANVPYGAEYTVHLPNRDFDVQFTPPTQTFTFDQSSGPVTFIGSSQALPETVFVNRIGEGGNGNAFEYTVGGRSWTSANNQVRDYFLLGVDGHLATLTSKSENDFVAELFTTPTGNLCPGETNLKKCKLKGWIGLSDQGVNQYQWVTNEAYDLNVFTGWPGDEDPKTEPNDPQGNENYVEINAEGLWSITNGASTTNEGYFTEWDADQPGSLGSF